MVPGVESPEPPWGWPVPNEGARPWHPYKYRQPGRCRRTALTMGEGDTGPSAVRSKRPLASRDPTEATVAKRPRLQKLKLKRDCASGNRVLVQKVEEAACPVVDLTLPDDKENRESLSEDGGSDREPCPAGPSECEGVSAGTDSACPVCCKALGSMTELARSLHVNHCLDGHASSAPAAVVCETCGHNLGAFTEGNRARHVAGCTGTRQQGKPSRLSQGKGGGLVGATEEDDDLIVRPKQRKNAPPPDPIMATGQKKKASAPGQARDFLCFLCGKNMKNMKTPGRAKHLKACAKKQGKTVDFVINHFGCPTAEERRLYSHKDVLLELVLERSSGAPQQEETLMPVTATMRIEDKSPQEIAEILMPVLGGDEQSSPENRNGDVTQRMGAPARNSSVLKRSNTPLLWNLASTREPAVDYELSSSALVLSQPSRSDLEEARKAVAAAADAEEKGNTDVPAADGGLHDACEETDRGGAIDGRDAEEFHSCASSGSGGGDPVRDGTESAVNGGDIPGGVGGDDAMDRPDHASQEQGTGGPVPALVSPAKDVRSDGNTPAAAQCPGYDGPADFPDTEFADAILHGGADPDEVIDVDVEIKVEKASSPKGAVDSADSQGSEGDDSASSESDLGGHGPQERLIGPRAYKLWSKGRRVARSGEVRRSLDDSVQRCCRQIEEIRQQLVDSLEELCEAAQLGLAEGSGVSGTPGEGPGGGAGTHPDVGGPAASRASQPNDNEEVEKSITLSLKKNESLYSNMLLMKNIELEEISDALARDDVIVHKKVLVSYLRKHGVAFSSRWRKK